MGGVGLNPPNAWGNVPECGYDFRRFRGTVVWEARSIGGRVNVEFLIDEHDKWFRSPAPYGDSMPRISLGIHSLCEEWQPFEVLLFDLPEENFTRVVGAFGWTASWSNNVVESDDKGTAPVEPGKFTFEIRDLRYTKAVEDQVYEINLPSLKHTERLTVAGGQNAAPMDADDDALEM